MLSALSLLVLADGPMTLLPAQSWVLVIAVLISAGALFSAFIAPHLHAAQTENGSEAGSVSCGCAADATDAACAEAIYDYETDSYV